MHITGQLLRRSRAVGVAVVAVLAVSCGSGDDVSTPATAGGGGVASEEPAPGTTATSSTTASPVAAIDGTWIADAGAVLGANTADLGGVPGLTCEGPITMTFSEGTLERTGTVRSAVGGLTGEGTMSTQGTYEVSGDTVTFSATTNAGTFIMAGQSMPFPESFGEGTATFAIAGDELAVTFTDPSVGTVTQVYTRV